VALIHAAQLLSENAAVQFYGSLGNDQIGDKIISIINQTPVATTNIKRVDQPSPYTYVFSDPNWHEGHGERTFINNIGAAWQLSPRDLDNAFFRSDIVEFGGTAIVPNMHDHLTDVLKKSKDAGSITVVNTVYDFRSEKTNPGEKWPLGDSEESFRYIDILLMDLEEALKISGTGSLESAASFYEEHGVSSFVITNGISPAWIYSDGRLFSKTGITQLPISETIINETKNNPELKGDTTGCGDNLVGGIIASVAWQISTLKPGEMDMIEACSWGIVSGGFTCFHMGGTYIEQIKTEKLNLIKPYYQLYKKQIRNFI
jgi:sugar/nucleoside kinase (ribokinase family)